MRFPYYKILDMDRRTTEDKIEGYSKEVRMLIAQPPSFWLQWGNVLTLCFILALFILSCFFYYEQSFTSRVAMPELKASGRKEARVSVYLPIEKRTEFLSDSVTVQVHLRDGFIEGKVLASTTLWRLQKEKVTIVFCPKDASKLSNQVVDITWLIQKGTMIQMLIGDR